MPRLCCMCNGQPTKYMVLAVQRVVPSHIPLDIIITPPQDTLQGYYCDECFANRMIGYAVSLKPGLMEKSISTLIPYRCKYCHADFSTAADLQTHRDAKHSDVDGHTVIEDPAKKAQQILAEDSKRWAAKYITPPDVNENDGVLSEEELRKQWLKNKPPVIPPEKMMGLGPQIREAMKKTDSYQCNQCSMVFYSKHSLANHRRAHQRRERQEHEESPDKKRRIAEWEAYQERKRGRPTKQSNPS